MFPFALQALDIGRLHTNNKDKKLPAQGVPVTCGWYGLTLWAKIKNPSSSHATFQDERRETMNTT